MCGGGEPPSCFAPAAGTVRPVLPARGEGDARLSSKSLSPSAEISYSQRPCRASAVDLRHILPSEMWGYLPCEGRFPAKSDERFDQKRHPRGNAGSQDHGPDGAFHRGSRVAGRGPIIPRAWPPCPPTKVKLSFGREKAPVRTSARNISRG